jgi:hypothetical protein
MFVVKPLKKNPERRNLVVVRAGPGSLHERWLENCPTTRNWDLLVSYYAQSDSLPSVEYEGICFHQGNKLKPLLHYHQLGWFAPYDYVWLPDPDIETDGHSINSLFEIMRLFDLSLAQPSLSHNSYSSHAITLQNPTTILRFTDFVEVMMPCFSQQALGQCAHTFADSNLIWGLDFVWPKLLGYPKNKIAVIDCLPMQHNNPVGSSYDIQVAFQEMFEILNKYEVATARTVLSAIERP